MCDLSLKYLLFKEKIMSKSKFITSNHRVLTKTQSLVIKIVGSKNVVKPNVADTSAVTLNVVTTKLVRTIFIGTIKFKSNLQHRLLECVDEISSSI